MLTSLQKDVMLLVRSAMRGEGLKLSDGFNLSDTLPIIRSHKIQSLAYHGAINCGVDKNTPAMKELFFAVCKATAMGEVQFREANRICDVFEENGIDHLGLKGLNIKQLYPNPDMRFMADADILIRTEQKEKIKEILINEGYREVTESGHEYIFEKPGVLHLELHKALIPPEISDYYNYFKAPWKKAIKTMDHRYCYSTEDEFIYVFSHFTRHFRAGGIGIKHLTDIWVYKVSYPDMNMRYIEAELKKLHMDAFFRNVMGAVSVWFEGSTSNDICDTVIDAIFKSGAYGSHKTYSVSQTAMREKKYGSVLSAKIASFLKITFLPYIPMCAKYPVLKKVPILLPCFWVVRWVDTLIRRRKNLARHTETISGIDPKDVKAFKIYLDRIGLDFYN